MKFMSWMRCFIILLIASSIMPIYANTDSTNNPPNLEPINNITVNEGELVTVTAIATDPDEDDLSYSIDDSRFSQNNNVFTWTPENQDVGTHDFQITVSDGLLTDSEIFTVTVNSINDILVGGCYVSNSTPNAEENIYLRFFIYNNGQQTRDAKYLVDTNSSDQNLEYTASDIIPQNFRVTWVCWAYSRAGVYLLSIVIDPDNEINEFYENNNILQLYIRVK